MLTDCEEDVEEPVTDAAGNDTSGIWQAINFWVIELEGTNDDGGV